MEVFQCTSQDMLTLQGLFFKIPEAQRKSGWGAGMDIFWYHTVT